MNSPTQIRTKKVRVTSLFSSLEFEDKITKLLSINSSLSPVNSKLFIISRENERVKCKEQMSIGLKPQRYISPRNHPPFSALITISN